MKDNNMSDDWGSHPSDWGFRPSEYRPSCLECGGRTPVGFALCDDCAPKVYRELGELISGKKKDETEQGTH